MLAEPRRPVTAGDIAALDDPDARENWELMLAFRDHLLAARSLEAAYLSRPFPKYARRFSEYDHLARVKEWSLASAGGAEGSE